MTGRFLIAGFPRSRTAWWSVATGALHEPISRQGWAAFAPRWRIGGVSDSGAAFWLPQILATHKPRVLIVERPYAEVVGSLERLTAGRFAMDWAQVGRKLSAAEAALGHQHDDIMRVAYDQLDSIEVVRGCLRWLRVNEPPNLEQLMHMNIQSDLAWNIGQLAEKAA